MTRNTPTSEFAELVRAEVETRREAIVSLARAVVTAPSVNPPGDTRLVVERVMSFFSHCGIEATDYRPVDTMPSVLVNIDSGRPGKHLLFNAHLDTMPPGDVNLWSVPPYELTRRDGRLYGLGMGNMKGAVVAMAHAIDILRNNRDQWNGSITFAAVSDEVVFGPNGAEALINDKGITGDALICGEGPGFKRLSNGEKGVLWVRIDVSAEPGHSSAVVRDKSASAQIAGVIQLIDGLTGWRGDETFADFTNRRQVEPIESPERETFLTANIGTVSSGTFIGQIATSAAIEIDFRIPPGLSIAHVLDSVSEELHSADIAANVSVIKGWEPNFTDRNTDIVQAWRLASDKLGIDFPEFAIRLPASDASRWRRLGVPAICYGPQPLYSSGIDDYAEEEELLNCTALYVLSACEFLSAPDSEQ
ncbi:MAG: M20/M25/M40 family metallo-hydrolase [Microbacteriaceae bacterium]|nr:M20/M25/M40 family metallo-hydrolase [Microbacteriaceae bacterium]